MTTVRKTEARERGVEWSAPGLHSRSPAEPAIKNRTSLIRVLGSTPWPLRMLTFSLGRADSGEGQNKTDTG